MAKMITRTVVGTQLTAKVANNETDEIYNKTIIVDVKLTADDKNKARNLVTKQLAENEVVIGISDYTPVEKLYGVSIADFMAIAKELNPETRKVIEN